MPRLFYWQWAAFICVMALLLGMALYLRQSHVVSDQDTAKAIADQPAAVYKIYDQSGADTGLFRDSQHVYCDQLFDQTGASENEVVVIPNADPATFVALSSATSTNPFFKDRAHVWVIGCWAHNNYPPIREIVEADARTFTVVGDSASADGNFLTGTYAKDDHHVYFIDNGLGPVIVVAGADPSTFSIVNGQADFDARDGVGGYLQGIKVL